MLQCAWNKKLTSFTGCLPSFNLVASVTVNRRKKWSGKNKKVSSVLQTTSPLLQRSNYRSDLRREAWTKNMNISMQLIFYISCIPHISFGRAGSKQLIEHADPLPSVCMRVRAWVVIRVGVCASMCASMCAWVYKFFSSSYSHHYNLSHLTIWHSCLAVHLPCLLISYLAYLLAFFLPYLLAFVLTYLLAFSLAHLLTSETLSVMFSDILFVMSADILFGTSSGILFVMSFDIQFDISSDIWHSVCHVFWHSICHICWHSAWHIF